MNNKYMERYYETLFNNIKTKCIGGIEHDWVEDFKRKEEYDAVFTPMKCRRCGKLTLFCQRY